MLKIYDEFAPRANVANTSYPHGHGKNESVVDANDGTPLTMKWYDDQLGFSEALIAFAGITPSGNADTALVSDRMDAFKIATCRIETATAYNDGDVTTVGLIGAGVDVTSYLCMVDPNTLTRWLVDGVTGTFTGDFNASTGVDSGLSSALTELKTLTSLIVPDVSVLTVKVSLDGQKYTVTGFKNNTKVGGGSYVWDATRLKADHLPPLVIDPDKTFPTDFSSGTQITNWITPSVSGTGCYVRVNKRQKLTCEAFGIYPDDGIDHRANGLHQYMMSVASQTGTHLLIPKGVYSFGWDNYESDVTVTFTKGAFCTGTVHLAINTIPGTPVTARPSNVSYYGEVGSFERVGCYNCDDVYVEKIVVKSNPTSGIQTSAGTHFYLDTNRLRIDEIIVHDVKDNGSYAFGVDGNSTYKPRNCTIGKVKILDSNTHGAYLMGSNIQVGSIEVDGYGAGTQTTDLPLATDSESAAPKGVFINRLTEGSKIGRIRVRQIYGVRTNAADGVYCDDGSYDVGDVDISGASARGFAVDAQVESPLVTANSVLVTNSTLGDVEVQKGNLTVRGSVTSSGAGFKGVYVNVGSTLRANTVSANNATDIGVLNAGTIVSREISCGSSITLVDDILRSTGKIITDLLSATNSTAGTTGGVHFLGSSGDKIGKFNLVGVGINSGNLAGLHLENVSNSHFSAATMSGGLGQGLRMVNLSDCSFNGFDVSDYDFNVIVSGLTRVSFTNCYNHDAVSTLTNMPLTAASFFNSDTMHT